MENISSSAPAVTLTATAVEWAAFALAHLQKQKVDCAWIDISEMDLHSAMRTNVTACRLRKLSAAIEAADGS